MKAKRFLALLLTLALVCSLAVTASADAAQYTFAAAELTAVADKEPLTGASFADNYIATFGELTRRTGSDGAVKSVEVGKNGASGFTFTAGGACDVTVECSSTGGSNASTVGLWDAEGNLVANNEGLTVVEGTAVTTLTWTGLPAGAYKVVSPDASEHNRGARIYAIKVVDAAGARAPRKAWDEVADPVITGVKVEGGTITVTYTMEMGYDGADKVAVTMLDGETVETDSGEAVFTPAASGTYSFIVAAYRDGEAEKSDESEAVAFTLPLAVPQIASAASAGDGKIALTWDPVAEATGYGVYMDGAAALEGPVTDTKCEISGLAIDSVHSFAVTALRGGEETAKSEAMEAVATKEVQRAWQFDTFGVSTRTEKNYSKGDLNRDGEVTVVSSDGAGKILAASSDGLAFYYTAIPVDQNFTLRAKAHVNSWENRSYQNGFGVAALDRIGSGSAEVWNNSVLVGGMRLAYYYDKSTSTQYAESDPGHLGDKYNMRLGIASLYRSGVTWDGLDAMGGEITFPPGFASFTQPLEAAAIAEGMEPGTYNIVSNGAELECPDLSTMTADFVLEIQRNNTGYFASYYDAEGNLIGRHKTYDPKALDQLDSEYVYAGFFTSRLMDATFSEVTLKVNDPSEDPAPEAKPKTQMFPTAVVHSAERANSADYDLIVMSNVAGTVQASVNGAAAGEGKTDAAYRADVHVTLVPGENHIDLTFLPDADQTFDDPDLILGSAEPIELTHTVTYETRLSGQKVLWTAPGGTADATGTKESPLALQTALDLAQPGQVVVVGEGTYNLSSLVIRKGVSGTEGNPIYLVADPAAASRPVLDFGGTGSGLLLQGDWWYLYGLDVTRANDEGVSVAGSHNVLDRLEIYGNLATGLQIARSTRSDHNLSYWPSYNLILNCTAHHNIDPGYSDADGFGAKLTCGVGNVFDGCVAYRNSDDGWDLYAKAESGPIGKVVIQNSVAYANGYLDDGSPAGDGNGFKMGGESITAYHELRNSVSFHNKNCGVTTNSCPDLQLFDVTTFDNDHLNVNFYTKLAKNTDFGATGVLSYHTSPTPDSWDQFAPTGSQDPAKVLNDTNYFWNIDKTANTAGTTVGAEVFASTDFNGFS
ncbi:MAG: right-handed parallel beta-helix repeat-containing protein, partial [Muribaculaceae bacterium]|nr:right-handed parallel beta-helix repeat-containing protein [Muribaculaceae bacterium]